MFKGDNFWSIYICLCNTDRNQEGWPYVINSFSLSRRHKAQHHKDLKYYLVSGFCDDITNKEATPCPVQWKRFCVHLYARNTRTAGIKSDKLTALHITPIQMLVFID